ncbi:23S rRNA (uridine(2552)-2'-O)-methyltransferase [Enterobacteriaceae endosymbiont of Donacia tomentosa]|uniref:RlmE family RNA methyltransferase n=1 Tax=Enterobacteriaceae endosymbiont of Donacia tomentosa TaxID=2675787 RepID=UPI001448CB49|nr:SAM-dependent methyltransferase [Enterobacteriaceae endosymbiont of Donacia tomentosa]QJC31746.1 23S rRNA (uridine(2552)-2'-O)-methyltransferase [Enterobacteriaceae endosymbiont of Donacia tomentosa]
MNYKKNNKSKIWLKNNSNDFYIKIVKKNKNKFRSRSWFKLEEIHKVDKIFKKDMIVLDLGASPGGWSQFASLKIGNKGKIIACDKSIMKSINNVDFIQGDLCHPNTINLLKEKLNNKKVQIIISDMSPNISGVKEIDIPRSLYLNKLALKLCYLTLEYNGNFLVKSFQGKGFNQYYKQINSIFKYSKIRKPNASRSQSCEIYIVAKGYKN